MELAPLADLYPSTTPPEFVPLSPAQLEQSFNLAPGSCSLPDSALGIPVVTDLAGKEEQKPDTAQARASGAPSAPKLATKIKLVGLKPK